MVMTSGRNSETIRKIRHRRVRRKVKSTPSRPRLCVFRSLNHIYAQLVDDSAANTLISVSTLDPQLRDKVNGMRKSQKAEAVGTLLAQQALNKGIKEAVFDRGGYRYHGRVKALAEGARKAGLKL
ncbi:MAG: 50S ribosomal protein L18 [Dehalococcoidia bacterium]